MSKGQSLLFKLLIVSLALISGCKVLITNYDEEQDDTLTSNNPEIYSFTIIDSYQQTSFDFDQQVEINAGISSGEFDVSYSVSGEAYYVYFILSNQKISGGGITYYSGVCGYSSCAVDLTCRFTNAIEMSCGVIGGSNQEVDVSPLVTSIPMDAYVILRACNSAHSICVEQYQAVELQ